MGLLRFKNYFDLGLLFLFKFGYFWLNFLAAFLLAFPQWNFSASKLSFTFPWVFKIKWSKINIFGNTKKIMFLFSMFWHFAKKCINTA